LAQKLSSPGLAQLRQRISIVQGLAPLSNKEVKNYVEHRLRIAGYKGAPIFTDEAYQSIAVATEGIPRNVNNFCFNALSLACALRKHTVDADVVNEVMADLDIQKLTWGGLAEATESPYRPVQNATTAAAEPEAYREIANAAEAAAYMQQIALKLRNWRESLEKAPPGAVHDPIIASRKEQSR